MGVGPSALAKLPEEGPIEKPDAGVSTISYRPHPQETFDQTFIDADSFYGRLRQLYSHTVLKTQLDQLKKQGSYDAFKLGWNPKYDISRVRGGKCSLDGSPPTLFWDSDVGKWIEAACYFLSTPDGRQSPHASEFDQAIEALIEMMSKAQQPDGYLGTYFTVVDKAGRLKNLRDMHELYCCGHLLEAALAHRRYSGSVKFLNIMLKYVDLLMRTFGPNKSQTHGYPGHPELELAILRLYSYTKDPKHYAFGRYLVEARGKKEEDLGGLPYFVWEAEKRKDRIFHSAMDWIGDGRYHQWHAPLHEQVTILGHSVRALYLVTAASDLDGRCLDDARRLWTDCVDNKMYPTGGIGSIPNIEGFSGVPHFLPNGSDEGGCYAETCASIACMMVSERLLSHRLDAKARGVLERCLLNNVLGGASLNGQKFSYGNKLATSGDELDMRDDWFDVCCCPPNLTRTMALLGGYMWSARTTEEKTIELDIYLFMSGKRHVNLGDGGAATVKMSTDMPWSGRTTVEYVAPAGWEWKICVPMPEYATNYSINGRMVDEVTDIPGFCSCILPASGKMAISFDMPVRLLAPHPATHQTTLAVARGPIVYTAETIDNPKLNAAFSHFADVGISERISFDEIEMSIGGISMIGLVSKQNACSLDKDGRKEIGSLRVVDGKVSKARGWKDTGHKLRMVPFFARANRGPPGHLRTMFLAVGAGEIGLSTC